jgi:hypothetical protein
MSNNLNCTFLFKLAFYLSLSETLYMKKSNINKTCKIKLGCTTSVDRPLDQRGMKDAHLVSSRILDFILRPTSYELVLLKAS